MPVVPCEARWGHSVELIRFEFHIELVEDRVNGDDVDDFCSPAWQVLTEDELLHTDELLHSAVCGRLVGPRIRDRLAHRDHRGRERVHRRSPLGCLERALHS